VHNFDIFDDIPGKRLEMFYKNYVQTFYVVRRKESFKESLSAILDSNIEGKMVDQVVSVFSLTKGKMKVLPVFFGVREYVANSGNQRLDSIEDLYSKENYKSLMERFYMVCSEYLSSNSGAPIETSRKIITDVYKSWIKTRARNERLNGFLVSRFMAVAKRIISKTPFYEADKINKAFGISLNQSTGELTLLNEVQNSDLNEIKALITKHNIKSF
jgi:hypothetical protein